MATANVIDQQGATMGTVELPGEIFDAPVNQAVLHQALVRQLANARQGTHDTKNRAEVRGGGSEVSFVSSSGATALRYGQLSVLDGFSLEEPQTRAVRDLLTAMEAGRRVLLVLGSHNEVLELSARNLPEVRVILASNLNVRDLLTADTVLVTRDALEHIGEVLG